MPAVINAWLTYKDASLCQELQDRIIYSYQQDFYKYARKHQVDYMIQVFNAIPMNIGKKFKMSRVDNTVKAGALKQALLLLVKAGIAYQCFHSAGHSTLLGAEQEDSKFKVFFFDIGLMQRMLGLDLKQWSINAMTLPALGGITEQLIAQEAIAYAHSTAPHPLFYWHREAKSSNAEVDFLFLKKGQVYPVEIKSNMQGGMRSLHRFLETHPQPLTGLKISDFGYAQQAHLEEIPLYGLEGWLKDE
jgi:hypothetical protein